MYTHSGVNGLWSFQVLFMSILESVSVICQEDFEKNQKNFRHSEP
jgi:hypothetical protein